VPSLAYPELVKGGTVKFLIGLLTHENMDIIIDVVELIHELTDEDVGADEGDGSEETEEPLKILVDNLVSQFVRKKHPSLTVSSGREFSI
jgi:beta-catenin-like protein 1